MRRVKLTEDYKRYGGDIEFREETDPRKRELGSTSVGAWEGIKGVISLHEFTTEDRVKYELGPIKHQLICVTNDERVLWSANFAVRSSKKWTDIVYAFEEVLDDMDVFDSENFEELENRLKKFKGFKSFIRK